MMDLFLNPVGGTRKVPKGVVAIALWRLSSLLQRAFV